ENKMVNFIIGCVLLYIGGWGILWAEPVNIFTFTNDFYFGKDAIAVKFNNAFYGFGLTNRFFDSYLVSMVLFGTGIAAMFDFRGSSNYKKEDEN
ncbi:MAG: hypothetical protein U9R37_05120, partial [Campylobacterota bacterium]|nr:hypothetical protein [Campylobacterota bacterium]